MNAVSVSMCANYFTYSIAFNPHNSFVSEVYYLHFADEEIGLERLKTCPSAQSQYLTPGLEFKSVWLLTTPLNFCLACPDSVLCSSSNQRTNKVSIAENSCFCTFITLITDIFEGLPGTRYFLHLLSFYPPLLEYVHVFLNF